MRLGAWKRGWIGAAGFTLALAPAVLAGPPFTTDDPEPVEFQHWELYLAGTASHGNGGWSGSGPQIEANYGALPELQLHIIMPMDFVSSEDNINHYGLGDTELGVKYRLIDETSQWPQLGTFIQAEIPTGDQTRDLGNGLTQVFLPLWLQKSYRRWTMYGGGGYWINPGAGNQNWWFMGLVIQRQLTNELAVGAEINHSTAAQLGGDAGTHVSLGGILDLSDLHHLLLSIGRGLAGPNTFQSYLAYQITFGPSATAPLVLVMPPHAGTY